MLCSDIIHTYFKSVSSIFVNKTYKINVRFQAVGALGLHAADESRWTGGEPSCDGGHSSHLDMRLPFCRSGVLVLLNTCTCRAIPWSSRPEMLPGEPWSRAHLLTVSQRS